MIQIIFSTVIASLLVGLVAKLYLDYKKQRERITSIEFLTTGSIIAFLVVPLLTFAGWKLSIANSTTFNEYWNGWEKDAIRYETTCYRDGSCRWNYNCDPYIVCVPVCTSDGKTTSCHMQCTTHYHSCPYCTKERSYQVTTTLGDYWIDRGRFPDNPQPWRGSYIPNNILNAAGVGDPHRWVEVKARVDSGRPGPVTDRRQYENFFLASDLTILKQYRGDIEIFRKHGMIPEPATEIYDFYYASKVYGVGIRLTPDWNKRLAYLNGALGKELEGDLHLIVVKHNLANENPNRYAIALKAAWLDKKDFAKNAISQNSIVVILGTDGTKVTWVQAFTGLPLGNEKMLDRIKFNLQGRKLTSDKVIGAVSYRAYQKQVLVTENKSIAEIVLVNPDTRFKRTKQETYLYLKGEIKPSGTAQFFIFFFALVLSSLCWIWAITNGESYNESGNYPDLGHSDDSISRHPHGGKARTLGGIRRASNSIFIRRR